MFKRKPRIFVSALEHDHFGYDHDRFGNYHIQIQEKQNTR